VLKNVERSNIKLDHMIEVNNNLRNKGRVTNAELILPLPGETKESFIKGLNSVLNSNASQICIYTLMMLYGTKFKNPKYINQFDYKVKYRIIPLNFGEYANQKIFDYEEAGVATKDLSFKDYIFLRALALLVEFLHNGKPFDEFFQYAKLFNIQPATMIKILYDNISSASNKIRTIMNDFIKETKNELWSSEKELIDYYRKDENYLKLKNGEVGGNLIYKYKSKNIIEASADWIDFFEKQILKAVKQKFQKADSIKIAKSEICEISEFCRLKIDGLLNINADIGFIESDFQYDILKWIDDGAIKGLHEYENSIDRKKLYFHLTSNQIKMRNDAFKRYGTDINALSKIVTRITSLESQYRKVRYGNETYLRDIYKKAGDQFIRYALSG
ncbi:MAG: hypothetical protein QF864_15290, partial [SAR202 cluster bacterium]|nr:hypothetical protein [SAR202 cluster bacterium]